MTTTQHQQASISPDEAKAIAQEAWIFGMPLVYIEIQIDTATHVSKVDKGHAPINQFVHYRAFPDASNRTVVGFNVDTLYSLAHVGSVERTDGPVGAGHGEAVLGDADHRRVEQRAACSGFPHGRQQGRSLRDRWADVEGHTTSGRDRTARADEPGDDRRAHVYRRTRRLRRGPCAARPVQVGPLSSWGKQYTPPDNVPLKEGVDAKTPVPKQVLALSPEDFFNRLNRLLVTNPPEPDDPKTMARLATLGIAPGATFRMDAFTPEVRKAIEAGVADGIKVMRETVRGKVVNGWQIALDMGRYGTKYTYRAGWTFFGVGGNLPEDAVYPFAELDGDGKPFNGANKYRLHFTKAEIPPVDAFWSLTMYDDDAYLVANPINRYALGDRSHLTFDADGGLTLYIQSDSPGKDKESNWLPAPKDAGFKLALRLYAPKKEVADGTWAPPPVKRAS